MSSDILLSEDKTEFCLDEARRILHISKRKCAVLLRDGVLPCTSTGKKTRQYRILRSDVEGAHMNILVTGASGSLGRNLVENLKTIRDGKNRTRPNIQIENIYEYDINNTEQDLDRFCSDCDFVVHCAGVKRPKENMAFIP